MIKPELQKLLDQNELFIRHPLLASTDGYLCHDQLEDLTLLVFYYQWGVFPWYNDGPYGVFYFPKQRYVIDPRRIHIPKSIRSTFNQRKYRVTFDQCFDLVIRGCAEVRRKGVNETWITDIFLNTYHRLHELGLAHSVEVWENDEMIGGLYGVSIGKIFSGESMFSLKPNASKFALISLAHILAKLDFQWIDCQIKNPYLEQFRGEELEAEDFFEEVKKNIFQPTLQGNWGPFVKYLP